MALPDSTLDYFVVCGVIAFAVVSILRPIVARRRLRCISNDEFIELINRHDIPEEFILAARRYLGGILGIDHQRLHPRHSFAFLTRSMGSHFSIGVNDMYHDLRELHDSSEYGAGLFEVETIADAIVAYWKYGRTEFQWEKRDV